MEQGDTTVGDSDLSDAKDNYSDTLIYLFTKVTHQLYIVQREEVEP